MYMYVFFTVIFAQIKLLHMYEYVCITYHIVVSIIVLCYKYLLVITDNVVFVVLCSYDNGNNMRRKRAWRDTFLVERG